MSTKFQKRVRTRMAKTGESYQAAYQALETPQAPMMSIIEFVENELEMRLWPVQKVILKTFYGLPLDDVTEFPVNRFSIDPLKLFQEMETEYSYLKRLHADGRSNIEAYFGETTEFSKLFLVLGRRSGKGLLVSCILAYETYRLTQMEDPHKRYGLSPNNRISVKHLTPSSEMASYIGEEYQRIFSQPVFADYCCHPSAQQGCRFWTKKERESSDSKGSVHLDSLSATFKGLRGSGAFAVGFDEFARFPHPEETWNAVTPSLAGYHPKNEHGYPDVDSRLESKLVVVSTPSGEGDFFHESFLRLRKDPVFGALTLQIPTWEINPTIPFSVFHEASAMNYYSFCREYGAKFIEKRALRKLSG